MNKQNNLRLNNKSYLKNRLCLNHNKIIDVSMDLNEKTVVWKNDKQPRLEAVARMPAAQCNFTWLSFGSHAGTHIDAPYYLFSDKWTSEQIPFERIIGWCQVLDMTRVKDIITAKDLKEHKIRQKIILLKTKNSYDKMEKYNPRHISLDKAAAEHLISQGVTTLGYDYQSFERNGEIEIHKVFLGKSITLIDNLRLKDTEEKQYFLICLPIKITGIDGAPARVILLEED